MSNLVCKTCFWNNLHQVRSKVKTSYGKFQVPENLRLVFSNAVENLTMIQSDCVGKIKIKNH